MKRQVLQAGCQLGSLQEVLIDAPAAQALIVCQKQSRGMGCMNGAATPACTYTSTNIHLTYSLVEHFGDLGLGLVGFHDQL